MDSCEGRIGPARDDCQKAVASSCRERFQVFEESAVPKLDIYPIIVRVDDLMDETLRERFDKVPTRLSLSPEQVDVSIDVGRQLLESSPEFRRLLGDLKITR